MKDNKLKLQKLFFDVFIYELPNLERDVLREDIPSWDSLGTVSLMNALMSQFQIDIQAEEMAKVRGLHDVIQLLQQKEIKI